MSQEESARVLELGTAESDVYTNKNFRGWCKGQDDGMRQRKATGVPTPLFARDGRAFVGANGKEMRGHKMYTSCSWSEMLHMIRTLPPLQRNFYELVYYDDKAGAGDPVNIYMDADLTFEDVEGEIPPDVMDDVYEEIFTCIELAIEKLAEMGAGGWHTAWKRADFVVNTMVADVPGKKISRHYLIHFPGNAMVKDVVHLKNFMKLVMDIHYQRIEFDKRNSCMHYFHKRDKAFRSIIDVSVYSKMRPYRMISCVKCKLDANACLWPLAPACTHQGSCEDALCFYRYLKKTDERDFLANLITYVPPGPDGKPIDVPLLELPDVPTPWLKHNDPCNTHRSHRLASYFPARTQAGPRAAAAAAAAAATSVSPVSYTIALGTRPDWRELFDVRDDTDVSDESDGDQPARKKPRLASVPTIESIMYDIATAIQTQTGDICTVVNDHVKQEGTAFIRSDSKVCPYECREHSSNHISYIVSLNLPLPSVYVRCLDPNCKGRIDAGEVKRVFIKLDAALCTSIQRDTLAYFNAQYVTAKLLRLK